MKSDSNSDLACQSYAGLNLCSCILIGVFHEAHILFWNTLLSQTPPDFLSWYPVVRLLKVYKHQVQLFLHFPVFIYHLPCCKYGISCPSARHVPQLVYGTYTDTMSTMLFDLIPRFITNTNHNIPSILVRKQLTSNDLIGRNYTCHRRRISGGGARSQC